MSRSGTRPGPRPTRHVPAINAALLPFEALRMVPGVQHTRGSPWP
jgi:hypothetical protein